ncbi:MAG TPA: CDP-alcohol phosphatidyltransferase family protein, partial [Pyrinomonadaceae bacterium]|nr:CDP-alcohol phosphatidyltransferase family protein [Pyrinomonadaceae bacterium]
GRVTRFGGFLDSSLDRLSDMVVLLGVMVFYARDTAAHSTLNVLLTGAAMIGSTLISYTSARAESLIPKCDVGFFRRPERVVLLIIGALSTHPNSESIFANRMPAVLWILAVGSFWTFAYRVYYTWRELNRVGTEMAAAAARESQAETRGAPSDSDPASNADAGLRDAARARRVPAPR